MLMLLLLLLLQYERVSNGIRILGVRCSFTLLKTLTVAVISI